MTDLTERLAAKSWSCVTPTFDGDYFLRLSNAATILPILLSEPELVAGLPESVRLSVLTARERAEMRHGEAVYAYNVLMRERWNDFDALEKSDEEIRVSLRALQKLALTPEADNGK